MQTRLANIVLRTLIFAAMYIALLYRNAFDAHNKRDYMHRRFNDFELAMRWANSQDCDYYDIEETIYNI